MRVRIEAKDVSYQGDGCAVNCYLAKPSDSQKHPGIVLIHEIFGPDEHIKNVARRIAAEGYVVLAPNLFSFDSNLTPENITMAFTPMLTMPPEKRTDPNYLTEQIAKMPKNQQVLINDIMDKLVYKRDTPMLLRQLSPSVDYLNKLDSVNGKIGSVGFCFGGGMSGNLACIGKTDASIIFYGENPPLEEVKHIKGALMGLYGGEDLRINMTLDALVKAMVENKKNFTMKLYPGAAHAFFNDTRPTYNKAAAEDAWKLVLDFFKTNL